MAKKEWFKAKTIAEIVTDEEIANQFEGTDFGDTYSHREILNNTILKCASGWYTGHTIKCIARNLELIHIKQWKLTRKGQHYLWLAYSNGLSL